MQQEEEFTGAVDAEQTRQVTGIDFAKAKEMAANALDQGVVITAIEDELM